jgi:hypothetical protein
MNMRQAIRLRCLDCGGNHCVFIRCPLYQKGKPGCPGNRTEAIRKYCKWCMNGHRINECSEQMCTIYHFRKNTKGDLHVEFLPQCQSGGFHEV